MDIHEEARRIAAQDKLRAGNQGTAPSAANDPESLGSKVDPTDSGPKSF